MLNETRAGTALARAGQGIPTSRMGEEKVASWQRRKCSWASQGLTAARVAVVWLYRLICLRQCVTLTLHSCFLINEVLNLVT